MAGKIFLKPGREKPLLNHHPWIFSGAIARAEDTGDGDVAEVYSAQGEWLARASFNSRSQIAARVWTFAKGELVDRGFLKRRLAMSVARRDVAVVGADSRSPQLAYRLVNAESDGLPGLVVDRYDEFLVAQFLTLGVESFKAEIVDALEELEPRGIYERSDLDIRRKEGLPLLKGVLRGEEPPDRIEIVEDDLRFQVDVKNGHKTGFYLDQRVNRRRAAPYLRGEVLNAFAYTGGFGIYAARAGARSVLNLDTSDGLLNLARDNFVLNGYESIAGFSSAGAFEKLREFREQKRRFDSIVLDPPKFVSSKGQIERALRGYKDLNLLAFQLLSPGGCLVTCSCSGLVTSELFQKVVFGAVRDADREGQIVEKLTQAPDHPISLAFPEAEYLKGLIVTAL